MNLHTQLLLLSITAPTHAERSRRAEMEQFTAPGTRS